MTYYYRSTRGALPFATISASIGWQSIAGTFLRNSSTPQADDGVKLQVTRGRWPVELRFRHTAVQRRSTSVTTGHRADSLHSTVSCGHVTPNVFLSHVRTCINIIEMKLSFLLAS